uniref:SHSP domain-containing protein n=1 Tax=Glycine max TaxID=3847 RepID=A0A0R0GKS6_SOYBN
MSDEKTNVQPAAAAEPVNEDFLPPSDWDRQNDSDTLILMLPGFRKEQMKVQVTSNRMLRVSGGRKISDNKLRQFRKEEPLSDYHDTKGITAKFEAGMLYNPQPTTTPPPTQQEPPKPPTQQEPSKPQPTTTPPPTQQEPPKPQPPPTTTQQKPPKPQPPPTTTPTKLEPPKPQQTTKTDHKTHAPQVNEKETKEDKISEEYFKTKTQTPVPQEPKAAHEDSQKKPQKEMMSKAKTEEERKTTSETQEMHGTAQTTFKEQKADHDEDSQKKEKGKAETDSNGIREAITSKAQETSPDGLSKSIIAMVHKILAMISGCVSEVKKQNKVPHILVFIILVLLMGHYTKTAIKTSFGGPQNQEL